jgi:hypothetical protein
MSLVPRCTICDSALDPYGRGGATCRGGCNLNGETTMRKVQRNAIAILRAATGREIGARRWGSGGGHVATYYPARRSSTGWDTFSWQEPDRVCRVDMARHRCIAKAEARKIIERTNNAPQSR